MQGGPGGRREADREEALHLPRGLQLHVRPARAGDAQGQLGVRGPADRQRGEAEQRHLRAGGLQQAEEPEEPDRRGHLRVPADPPAGRRDPQHAAPERLLRVVDQKDRKKAHRVR